MSGLAQATESPKNPTTSLSEWPDQRVPVRRPSRETLRCRSQNAQRRSQMGTCRVWPKQPNSSETQQPSSASGQTSVSPFGDLHAKLFAAALRTHNGGAKRGHVGSGQSNRPPPKLHDCHQRVARLACPLLATVTRNSSLSLSERTSAEPNGDMSGLAQATESSPKTQQPPSASGQISVSPFGDPPVKLSAVSYLELTLNNTVNLVPKPNRLATTISDPCA